MYILIDSTCCGLINSAEYWFNQTHAWFMLFILYSLCCAAIYWLILSSVAACTGGANNSSSATDYLHIRQPRHKAYLGNIFIFIRRKRQHSLKRKWNSCVANTKKKRKKTHLLWQWHITRCMTILLYGLEACARNKSDIGSLVFALNIFLWNYSKLITCINIHTVKCSLHVNHRLSV